MAVGVLTGVEPGTKSRASALARLNPVSTLLVSCLALAGCTTWVKPGATGADLARDQAECNYEAESATVYIRDPIAAGVQQGSLEVSCMQGRGWTVTRN